MAHQNSYRKNTGRISTSNHGHENQIQALEFTNEEHQQEVSKLNDEINDLIANRHVALSGCFDHVLCFIKKEQQTKLSILRYSMSI